MRGVRSALVGWVALLAVGAAGPLPAARAQTPEPLGVVLCVPAAAYGEVKALNEGAPRHTVTLLHLTQAVFGSYRSQAANVSIRPRTPSPGAPLEFRLPANWFPVIEEMNPNTELERVSATAAFVTARTLQLPAERSYVLARTRFLMVPLDALFALQQLNPTRGLTLVHSALLTSGTMPIMVALVAMDQAYASGVLTPQAVLPTLILLNTNLRVVNPRLVVSGVPVATVDVLPVNPPNLP